MAVIDSEGRLFGRLNLVDGLLVVLLLVAIPIGYGAHLMFRDPPARLLSVTQTLATQGTAAQVAISGENLRPYMRVSFGTTQAATFLYFGPTSAAVPLPALPPGSYDVVLFDYMREVARLPGAITITGPAQPPTAQVLVSGAFTALAPGAEADLTTGAAYPGLDGMVISILSAGPVRAGVGRLKVSDTQTLAVPMPDQKEVDATLLLTCQTRLDENKMLRCWAGTTFLAPGIHLTLQGPKGTLIYRVERIEQVPAATEAAK